MDPIQTYDKKRSSVSPPNRGEPPRATSVWIVWGKQRQGNIMVRR